MEGSGPIHLKRDPSTLPPLGLQTGATLSGIVPRGLEPREGRETFGTKARPPGILRQSKHPEGLEPSCGPLAPRRKKRRVPVPHKDVDK